MLFNKTRQDNIQIFNKFIYLSIGQNKSKIQKHLSKLFILIETAA